METNILVLLDLTKNVGILAEVFAFSSSGCFSLAVM